MSGYTGYAILVGAALMCGPLHAVPPPNTGGTGQTPSSPVGQPSPGVSTVPYGLVPLPQGGLAQATHAVAYQGDPSWGDEGPLDQMAQREAQFEPVPSDSYWLDHVRVGYDRGFVVASDCELDLETTGFPFMMRFNGWGQLRHTVIDSHGANPDLNQLQLKRARIVVAGHALNPDFRYFVQMDGRSSSGDDIRLLDYFLTYDFGRQLWCHDRGTIGFKTGKYKMPFTMARYVSGQEFQFTDRSMSSMFFDVNRSLGWGLYGGTTGNRLPVQWELAVFNGLVTGGAETGSSGSLDNNFAYSARVFAYPVGEWGDSDLADLSYHDSPAVRLGGAFASSTLESYGTTEFGAIRVVDSGNRLSAILPTDVDAYRVALYAIDAGCKFRGLSLTMEYYLRTIDGFRGAAIPDLFDHGIWLQLGYFVVPTKLELLARWSRVDGNSGTLGVAKQSADEVAGGLVWYFNGQHARFTVDATYLNGAPIDSSSLDIAPGEIGWLFRSQIQFSF